MTKRQFIFIIACFIQGSSLYTMYYYHMTSNETWMTFICGVLLSLLLMYLYSELCETHPSRDLVQINEAVYGKVFGKILSLAYLYSFIVSCSVALRETGQFVAGNLLMETNWLHILLIFLIVCAWASNSGIKYFASVSTFTCLFMYGFSILLIILLLPQRQFKFMLPMMQNTPSEYARSIGTTIAMPFTELCALMMIVPELDREKDKKKLWKNFALGIAIGAPFLLITILRDTLILGPLMTTFSYPTYEVIRLINYNMFSHIETLYGALLIFLLFFKAAIVFYCITRMLTQIFKCQRNIVFTSFTAGLLMLTTQQLSSSNIQLLNLVMTKIPYLLLIIQVGLPIVTLIIAKIKNAVKCKAGDVKC